MAWLFVWSKVQTCIWSSGCHCNSLSLASVKSRLVLPFWYRLTRVVSDKGLLNGCWCCCCHFYGTYANWLTRGRHRTIVLSQIWVWTRERTSQYHCPTWTRRSWRRWYSGARTTRTTRRLPRTTRTRRNGRTTYVRGTWSSSRSTRAPSLNSFWSVHSRSFCSTYLLFRECSALCGLRGVMRPWFDFWLRHHILFLLIYTVCFPTWLQSQIYFVHVYIVCFPTYPFSLLISSLTYLFLRE